MAGESSFDVVSKVDIQEVKNAVDQARREIETRFDFKGSRSEVVLDEKKSLLDLVAESETRMKALIDVLQSKLIKRGVDVRAIDWGAMEEAAKGTVRQQVTIKQGLDSETAKKIVKMIKDKGLKVQAQMQGDQVRVTAKSKDDLQAVIHLLREEKLGMPVQFANYR